MRDSIDLLDPHFYAPNPHEAYTWMREHEPVFRDEKNELWAITKHADVRDVELDDAVFVSGRGYRAVHYPDETNRPAPSTPSSAGSFGGASRRRACATTKPRSASSSLSWSMPWPKTVRPRSSKTSRRNCPAG